jgi:hypothetical protein
MPALRPGSCRAGAVVAGVGDRGDRSRVRIEDAVRPPGADMSWRVGQSGRSADQPAGGVDLSRAPTSHDTAATEAHFVVGWLTEPHRRAGPCVRTSPQIGSDCEAALQQFPPS